MSDPVKELGDLLRDLDVPVSFGLRAQGHLPKIREMLAAGSSWDDIGAAIGWQPKAAREWFDREDFADLMLTADRKRIRRELLAFVTSWSELPEWIGERAGRMVLAMIDAVVPEEKS